MRTRDLWFYKARQPDGLLHLSDTVDYSVIPEGPGAYVFGTSDGTRLVYPNGRSPIYYIGQSGNLQRRIQKHHEYILKVDVYDEWWIRRYQYAATFGATVAWYSTRGKQTPQSLETALIDEFYRSYFSIPVANGSWPSG